jgi:hypothetical protein
VSRKNEDIGGNSDGDSNIGGNSDGDSNILSAGCLYTWDMEFIIY